MDTGEGGLSPYHREGGCDLIMQIGTAKYGVRDAAGDLSVVAWALCAGADFINSARGFMFALGCIQALRCHTNTCPTGITTHNRRLQRGLVVEEKYVRVANYVRNMNKEIDMIAPEVAQRLQTDYPHDRARGYTVGQIRGAVTIKRPLD